MGCATTRPPQKLAGSLETSTANLMPVALESSVTRAIQGAASASLQRRAVAFGCLSNVLFAGFARDLP